MVCWGASCCRVGRAHGRHCSRWRGGPETRARTTRVGRGRAGSIAHPIPASSGPCPLSGPVADGARWRHDETRAIPRSTEVAHTTCRWQRFTRRCRRAPMVAELGVGAGDRGAGVRVAHPDRVGRRRHRAQLLRISRTGRCRCGGHGRHPHRRFGRGSTRRGDRGDRGGRVRDHGAGRTRRRCAARPTRDTRCGGDGRGRLRLRWHAGARVAVRPVAVRRPRRAVGVDLAPGQGRWCWWRDDERVRHGPFEGDDHRPRAPDDHVRRRRRLRRREARGGRDHRVPP